MKLLFDQNLSPSLVGIRNWRCSSFFLPCSGPLVQVEAVVDAVILALPSNCQGITGKRIAANPLEMRRNKVV